jgi:MFS family permease
MSQIESESQIEEQSTSAQTRSGFFYGWWVVVAGVVMLTLTSGIGYYGLGVFLPFLEKEFKAGSTLVSLGITTFFLVSGVAGPFTGRRVDLFGPRAVMVVGGVLFGLGLVGLALSQELWHTYLAYAVMALGFNGMGLVTVSAVVSNWFYIRRGLAIGLAMCGLSLGGVIIVPLTTTLISNFNWRVAAIALAGVVWITGIPLSLLLILRRPADMGLLPDGAKEPLKTVSRKNATSAESDWTLAASRRTLTFWAIAVGYLLVYLAQTGVLLHQLRFLTYGTPAEGAISLQAASFAISATAVASIAGRLALGAVIDRLNPRWVAVAIILLQASATTGLLFARGNIVMVYVSVFAFGLGTGCVVMLHSLLVSNMFGISSFGAIYGATMVITGLGTAGGPWLASFLFDWFGSYNIAFLLFATIDVLAAVAVAFARRPEKSSLRSD